MRLEIKKKEEAKNTQQSKEENKYTHTNAQMRL